MAAKRLHMVERHVAPPTLMGRKPVHVAVSHACSALGQIIISLLCQGEILGPGHVIILSLLDHEAERNSLERVQLDLWESGYPLVDQICLWPDWSEPVDVLLLLSEGLAYPGQMSDPTPFLVKPWLAVCTLKRRSTDSTFPDYFRARRGLLPLAWAFVRTAAPFLQETLAGAQVSV
jgi:hypothetical protein